MNKVNQTEKLINPYILVFSFIHVVYWLVSTPQLFLGETRKQSVAKRSKLR